MNTKLHNCFIIKGFNVFLITLLLVSSAFVSKAQAPKFSIKVKFAVQQGGLENSLITIIKNGQPNRVIDPNKGKYFIDLDLNAEYQLVFTKVGHITKTVVIDTHVPNGRENEEFAGFTADVGLEMQPEDKLVTYSQPVGRIKYSIPAGDFDYDKDYTATAIEAQKKDVANAIPKPKPPTPNPRPTTTTTTPPPVAPSNPIPVVVKQPEYKPEPEAVKPKVVEPETPQKPIVKNREERSIQKDRLKITIVIINIDGVNFEYKKEEYSWGGVYFYKDGKNITENTYTSESD